MEAYPAHDEVIGDDSLTSIQVGYKWRKLIAGLLAQAWRLDLSETSLDNDDLLSLLLLDFYDV